MHVCLHYCLSKNLHFICMAIHVYVLFVCQLIHSVHAQYIPFHREVERKEAVKRGSTGPLIVRYYEKWPKLDAARMKFEARMRQARLKRQGVDTSLDELEEKRCLMNQLPDGTTFCL